MTNTVNLYPVTKEAAEWRDLGLKTKRAVLAAKVTLAVGIVVVLAGMALGLYFSATTQPLFCQLPALVGAALVTAMVVMLILLSHFDQIRNGTSEDFSKNEVKDALVDLLKKGELKDIYAKYFKKNGGLQPLVDKGYILPEDANALRLILEEYHEKRKLMDDYVTLPLVAHSIQNNRLPEEYNNARLRLEELDDSWVEMRGKIQKALNIVTPSVPAAVQNGFTILPTLKPMQPTSEAKRWRDIDAADKNLQTMFRVLLVAGIILLLLGIAISCYFCSTTTNTYVAEHTKKVIVESNAPLSVIPGLLGGLPCLFMIAGFFVSNFELENNNFASDSLEKLHFRDGLMLLLTKGELKEVHSRYYRRNGGLGNFVRKGYLTVSQGERLRHLLRHYDKNKKALAANHVTPYYSTPFLTSITTKSGEMPSYHSLTQEKERFEALWKDLQVEIWENFISCPSKEKLPTSPLEKVTKKPSPKKDFLEPDSPPKPLPIDHQSNIPYELREHIFGYMPAKDICNVMQVNKACKVSAKKALNLRENEYGLELPILLKGIAKLVQRGYIEKKCMVFRSDTSRSFDSEATFKKIVALTEKEGEYQRAYLGDALVEYTEKGDTEMVKVLLLLGANLERRDQEGKTPLILAIEHRKEEIAELLIKKGADTNAVDNNAITPLLYAVESRSTRMACLLLDNNAVLSINHYANPWSSNLTFGLKNTPLHFAAQSLDAGMIRLLLHYGADKTLQNAWNKTPLQYITYFHSHLMELFADDKES